MDVHTMEPLNLHDRRIGQDWTRFEPFNLQLCRSSVSRLHIRCAAYRFFPEGSLDLIYAAIGEHILGMRRETRPRSAGMQLPHTQARLSFGCVVIPQVLSNAFDIACSQHLPDEGRADFLSASFDFGHDRCRKTSFPVGFQCADIVVNDIGIPHDSYYRPAVKLKARDGFCPVGPWVMERDAVANPDSLCLRVYINNELRQENSTVNLVRSVSRLISEVTDFMTLNAGDVLLTGVPEGAPLAKAGDRIRIEIEHVGRLENTVVPEDEWIPGGTL